MARARSGSRKLLRELNTKRILNVIRQSEPISQVDVFNRTALSAGTVAGILKDLRRDGRVEELGPVSARVGRPRTLLRLNPTWRYAVGVQLSAEETRLAVTDLGAHVVARADYPTCADAAPARAMQTLGRRIQSLLRQARVPTSKVLGVGLGVDGIVDVDRGVLRYSAHFPWRDAPLKRLLEKPTHLGCVLEGTGPAMAFGEFAYGAGQHADTILCMDIDAGIGAVAVAQGRIVRGANHMAGEIGHAPVVWDGPPCRCGRRGCLEAVASGTAIVAAMRRRLAEGARSTLSRSRLSGATREVVGAVFAAAEAGDRLARNVTDEAIRYLSMAVAQLVSFVDPQMVILMGLVTHASRGRLRDAIDAYVSDHVLNGASRSVPIREGALGEDAAVVGAAALVTESVYRAPIEG